ncbi:MAG: hypothetical protein ACREMP_07440 [Candidatus Tyrphobacter sp.]
MYIQPYEPQESSFGSQAISGLPTPACMSQETPLGSDAIAAPWSQEVPGLSDGAGALGDAPFGALGLGGMLSSLTGMMQQLAQMMQALVGRLGGEPGSGGGCTQGMPVPQRYTEEASTPMIE